MPRRKRQRKIIAPPAIKGLSVFGASRKKSEKVRLYFEEYEAIKYLDYENLTQEEAAVYMEVSRPTLTRIYESARNKVARALVEGLDLIISGGNFQFGDDWFRCNGCKANFNIFEETTARCCPICQSEEVVSLNEWYQQEE